MHEFLLFTQLKHKSDTKYLKDISKESVIFICRNNTAVQRSCASKFRGQLEY